MLSPSLQPFSVGDRVVYRDPQAPRNPLAGEVIEVTEHAVSVRYDAYPATASPGVIAAEQAADVLRWEQVDGLTRPQHRPDYWVPGER
jgi:hypothetical protein